MIARIALAALLFILAPSAASAAVTCTMSATGVDFGEYSGLPRTRVGAIVITCVGNGSPNYTLRLSTGGSGGYFPRQMRNGPNTLAYNLYSDAALTQVWGDGLLGTTAVSGTIDLNGQGISTVTFSVPVYGQIPGLLNPAPGIYSDTIVATLRYQGVSEITTSFLVTANVVRSCTVNARDLQFFSYSGTQKDAQTEISVNCTSSTAWNVGLNPGTSPGATVTTRKMTRTLGPVSSLAYGLFRDPAHAQNWGNTVGTDTVAGIANGNDQTLTVYGRIPASQSPAPGSYRDTITATLTF